MTNLSPLNLPQFPLSSAYDPEWVTQHQMGPNVLWLTEWLTNSMDLSSGSRVLDLGCGKALSSIFLAKEFHLQVWAADLWVRPSENLTRIAEHGLEDRIFPIHADARKLPFAEEFFDAIISVDAFEYFGTDACFLPTLVRHLKPRGQIGVVNAGLNEEVETLPPEWPSDFAALHTPQWWRRHWEMSRCVEVDIAESMAGGRELWLLWNDAIGETDDEYLRSDPGANLGFHRLVAHREDESRQLLSRS